MDCQPESFHCHPCKSLGEIKTEADSNDITEYQHDDMPSTGMIAIHYECILCVPRLL